MKILYNVTVTLELAIEQDWLLWMREVHIPKVMETQCFQMYRMARIIDPVQPEGPAYTVQYLVESQKDLNRYLEHHAATLRQQSQLRFGNKALSFRSIMEIVE